jgi:hypothetical protein
MKSLCFIVVFYATRDIKVPKLVISTLNQGAIYCELLKEQTKKRRIL